MLIRALIFDIGGVLVCSENRRARRRWETRLGLPEGGLSIAMARSGIAVRAGNGEIPEEEAWRQVATLFGLDDSDGGALQADFHRGEILNAALATYIRQLRPHYQIALLSNAWSGARQRLTRLFHLDDLADVIIMSAEEGFSKPDPRLYRLVTKRLGVRPFETLFVDNNPKHVAAAEQVGMHGVLFTDTEHAIAQIRAVLAESLSTPSHREPGS